MADTADVDFMRPTRFAEGRPNHIPTVEEWPYDPAVDKRFP